MTPSAELAVAQGLHPSGPREPGRSAADESESRAIEWLRAGHDGFAFLRSHATATGALATAVDYGMGYSPAAAHGYQTALDLRNGSSAPRGDLSGFIGAYVPLSIDCRRAVGGLGSGPAWKAALALPPFELCVFSHVIPAARFAAFATGSGVRFAGFRGASGGFVETRDAVLDALAFVATGDSGGLMSRLTGSGNRDLTRRIHAFALRRST